MKTKQERNKAPHRKGFGANVGDSTDPPQAPTAGSTQVRPPILVRSRRSSFIPAASKAAACALLLLALQARSQLAPDGAPLQYSATLFAQGNPRALALDLRLQYRHELGAAGSGSAVGGFADVAIGPAGLRPGVGIEIQPLANLSFGADYSASYYFGTVGLAQSYPSPNADYGSGAFTAPVSGPGGSYALWVQQLSMHATLQAILSPFAVRSTTRAARFFADLHPNDRVFYDPLFDVTVYKNGWVGQNDTDLVYPWTSSLIVGLRHTLTLAWYPDDAYAPGEPRENPNTPISKLGPVASWQFLQSERDLVQRGTLLLAAQWYLAHRYRNGETVSGALPLFGFGLVFSGDVQRGH